MLTMAALMLVLIGSVAVRRIGRRGRSPGARSTGVGLGAAGIEELHALFNPNKRVQIEQRQEQLALRDDNLAGAPPGTGVDLERGVAVFGRRELPRGA
ncbi:DUF6191 domain-containing protein [Kitasatospora sp. NPDC088351]|uniref:DUF6191 domain-containing protein n=1 Tax=unclassified Kitasatospora TaxID=2633591 RepID=UPI00344795B7